MKLLVHSALAMLALAASGARGIQIDASSLAPPPDVAGKHQLLQKTWTISSVEALEKLVLHVPGRVFIDVAGSVESPAATIPAATPAATTPSVVRIGSSSSSDNDRIRIDSSSSSDNDRTRIDSASGSGTGRDTVVVVAPSAASSASHDVTKSNDTASNDDMGDNDDDIVFPSTHATTTRKPLRTNMSAVGSNAIDVDAQVAPTQLRRVLKEDDDDSDSDDSDDKKQHEEEKPHAAAAAVVATIVVTGSSEALLQLIDVVPLHKHEQNGVRLQLLNQDAVASGFILTQITVAHAHVLRHVATRVADAVVISDRVLVTNDNDTTVKLSTAGAGSLFVVSRAQVALHALAIDHAGDGLVQVEAPSLLLADKLTVHTAGSAGGTVALLVNASITTPTITAAVAGTGDVLVQTAALTADTLTADVYGAGAVSFSTAGTVAHESLTLAGAGSVLVGSLHAKRVDVSVYGTGEVLVDAIDKLKVKTTFTGAVGYVGAKPAKVKTSKWLFWRTDIVYKATDNRVITHAVVAPPARFPSFAAVVVTQTRDKEPTVVVSTARDNNAQPTTNSVAAATTAYWATVTSNGEPALRGVSLWAVGPVAAVVGVAFIGVHRVYNRYMRREYQPLV